MELKAALEEAMQFKCGSSDAFEYWAASEGEEEEVSFTYLWDSIRAKELAVKTLLQLHCCCKLGG